MFLTSILKLFNLLYSSWAFQLKVGYYSGGPLALGNACTALLLLAGLSACLTVIIAALVTSVVLSSGCFAKQGKVT